MSDTPAVPVETRPPFPPRKGAPSLQRRLLIELAESIMEQFHCDSDICEDSPESCPCGGDECWRCAAAQAIEPPPWLRRSATAEAAPQAHPLVCACGKPWPTFYCGGEPTPSVPARVTDSTVGLKAGCCTLHGGGFYSIDGKCDVCCGRARVTEGMTFDARAEAIRLINKPNIFQVVPGGHGEDAFVKAVQEIYAAGLAAGSRSSTEAVRREARAEAFAECLRELHRCGTHADVVDAIARLAAETPPEGTR